MAVRVSPRNNCATQRGEQRGTGNAEHCSEWQLFQLRLTRDYDNSQCTDRIATAILALGLPSAYPTGGDQLPHPGHADPAGAAQALLQTEHTLRRAVRRGM